MMLLKFIRVFSCSAIAFLVCSLGFCAQDGTDTLTMNFSRRQGDTLQEKRECNAFACLLFLSKEGTVIEQRRISVQEQLVLDHLPSGVNAMRITPLPWSQQIAAYKSETISIQPGRKDAVDVPLTKCLPKQVTVNLQDFAGKPLGNHTVSIRDVTYGQSIDLPGLATDAKGALVFFGYPERKYTLSTYAAAPTELVQFVSPEYSVGNDNVTSAFNWKLDALPTVKIAFYETAGNSRVAKKAMRRVNIIGDHGGTEYPVTNGMVEVNLTSTRYAGSKSLSIMLSADEAAAGYHIVEGEQLDLTKKSNPYIVVLSKISNVGTLRFVGVDGATQQHVNCVLFYRLDGGQNVLQSTQNELALAAGNYEARVYCHGYRLSEVYPVTIAPGGASLVNAKLTRAEECRGKISDFEKMPTCSASLVCAMPQIRPIPVSINKIGEFACEYDPQLKPVLVITCENMASTIVPLDIYKPGQTMQIRLENGIKINGTVAANILASASFKSKRNQILFFDAKFPGIPVAGDTLEENGAWATNLAAGEYTVILANGSTGLVISHIVIGDTPPAELQDLGSKLDDDALLHPSTLDKLIYGKNDTILFDDR